MKKIWECKWQSVSEDGPREVEQTTKYPSFEEAKKAIRKMISQIDIHEYTLAMRNGSNTSFRAAMADFLDDYLSRSDFFTAKDILPSCEPKDYSSDADDKQLQNDAGVDIDDEYYEEDDEDELEDFEIYISSDCLSFQYDIEEAPRLSTNMVVMEKKDEDYSFEFYFDEPNRGSGGKIKGLNVRLNPKTDWGTAAYPLLILKILESCKDPLDQQHIISRIENDYDTRIERKALGRNIALLKELGYDIRHGAEGYYIPPKTPALEQEDLRILVDSIEANEALDDIGKRELINRLCKM